MTHLASNSRTTSDALRPSALALDCAAAHSSSSMRTLRSVVLGIDGADEPRLEGAGGQVGIPADDVAACEVLDDSAEVSGLDVLDALAVGEDSGEGRDYWVAHVSSVPTRVPTRKGENVAHLERSGGA